MQWNIINSRSQDGFTFVSVTFPFNKPDSILIEDLQIQNLINYINEKCIRKAYIQSMYRFDFISNCPSLEHITVELQLPFKAYKECRTKGKTILAEYDFKPITDLPDLKSLSIINNEREDVKAQVKFGISKIKHLQMYSGEFSYITDIKDAKSLRALNISHYTGTDFHMLESLSNLDTIQFTFSKLQTLDAIENFSELQCLYLYYNRSLKDISALSKVKGTLKALRIENCPKIEDFSVLGELENLELLELVGSNKLPNLDFLKSMKNLKTFVFDMNVLDGDLTSCLNLSYVYSDRNRKHYNLKDSDLPKGEYVRGNEDIEEWRRLE